jgi:hypothetical protein
LGKTNGCLSCGGKQDAAVKFQVRVKDAKPQISTGTPGSDLFFSGMGEGNPLLPVDGHRDRAAVDEHNSIGAPGVGFTR